MVNVMKQENLQKKLTNINRRNNFLYRKYIRWKRMMCVYIIVYYTKSMGADDERQGNGLLPFLLFAIATLLRTK